MNDGVKAAAANSSGLGKWKVTPHFVQGMGDKSRDAGVPRSLLGGRKDYRQAMGNQYPGGSLLYELYNTIVAPKCGHGQTEAPKRSQTEPKAVADGS
ncbi:hypothetical protein N7501_010260 [Penicillium viridicatum]|nr:hypothetical protein N7501_010260 [Penicillium viridicatum]